MVFFLWIFFLGASIECECTPQHWQLTTCIINIFFMRHLLHDWPLWSYTLIDVLILYQYFNFNRSNTFLMKQSITEKIDIPRASPSPPPILLTNSTKSTRYDLVFLLMWDKYVNSTMVRFPAAPENSSKKLVVKYARLLFFFNGLDRHMFTSVYVMKQEYLHPQPPDCTYLGVWKREYLLLTVFWNYKW